MSALNSEGHECTTSNRINNLFLLRATKLSKAAWNSKDNRMEKAQGEEQCRLEAQDQHKWDRVMNHGQPLRAKDY